MNAPSTVATRRGRVAAEVVERDRAVRSGALTSWFDRIEVEEQDPRLAADHVVRDEQRDQRRGGRRRRPSSARVGAASGAGAVGQAAPAAGRAAPDAPRTAGATDGPGDRAGGDEQQGAKEARAASKSWHGRQRSVQASTPPNARARRRLAIEWRPVTRFQKLAARDPRDRPRAGHDRRHRPGHRFRASAARTGRSATARSSRRSDDPKAWIEWIHRTVAAVIGFEILGAGLPRRPRPPRPAVDRVAVARAPWRSSGSRPGSGARPSASATAASRSPRTWRRRCCSSACSSTSTVRAGLPGAARRSRLEPAVHAPRRVRGGRDVRAAAVRVAGDRHDLGARLPRLAADGRLARSRPLTDVTTAHVLHRWVAAIVGADRAGDRRRGLADAARPADRSSGSRSARPSCSRSRSRSAAPRS